MDALNKNDKVDIKIVDMAETGEGIGKIDSLVFFVKNAVIGDYVNAVITKVTKNIIYAKALEIKEKSEYRVDSPCDVSNLCGGCTLLNVNYNAQIKLKEENFFRKLKTIAGLQDEEIKEVYKGFIKCDKNLFYRNKIQLPIAKKDSAIITGFYKNHTHEIVENDICQISFKYSEKIINIIKNEIEKLSNRFTNGSIIYDENTHSGIFREIFLRIGNNTNELSITLIVNDDNYEKNIDMYKRLSSSIISAYNKEAINEILIKTITLNINTNKTNVLFGTENIVLYGNGYINDYLLNTKFQISSQSFYQVNRFMTENLYLEALNFIREEKTNLSELNVYDLYCGIGTISLIFARYVRSVLGIEIVPKAIENANENKRINNINNAKFIVYDAEKLNREYLKTEKLPTCDLVILDPPRKGLNEDLINTIKEISPKYVLYISCDQGTLSRDLKSLKENYDIRKIKCVDMFPHTMHCETIVLLHIK